MKKAIEIAVAVLLGVAACAGCDKKVEEQAAGGDEPEQPLDPPIEDGTATNPYLIDDREDMEGIQEKLVPGEVVFFRMVADVDMEGAEWEPLNDQSPYDKYISFDGNGKKLSGFKVQGAEKPAGLFSVLNGMVHDLTVDGAEVTATTGAVGVIAGDLGNGGTERTAVENVTIVNSTVGSDDFNGVGGIMAGNVRKVGVSVKNISVKGSAVTSKNNYVGGLIGFVRTDTEIYGCSVSGCTVKGKDVTGGLLGCFGNGSASGSCALCFVENTTVHGTYRKVGGLTGIHDSGKIESCRVESDVAVSSESYFVGGLTGYQQNSAILENCYSRASVSGTSSLGGLVGEIAGSGSISCCYASGTVTGSETAGGLVAKIGAGNTVSKCISWNSELPLCISGSATNSYTKASDESGTVSSHAREAERAWSEDVWDFSTPFPTIKGTGGGETPEPEKGVHIIPWPNKITFEEGSFNVKGAAVYVDDALDGAELARQFASRLGVTAGSTSGEGMRSGINFLVNSDLGDEEYTLSVSAGRVVVKAATRAGVLYAVQTLKQLLPASVYGGAAVTDEWTLPCLTISDKPRFPWRGMHLDVSRHFFTVAEVKELLDIMALYKLNRFHWHLSDDQGWRIEIEGDEDLVRKGAYRGTSHPAYPGCDRDNGFYTREQVAEIVAYAHERGIIVVPEIDIPGHAAAILTAHRELGCVDKEYSVWTGFGINTELLCVAKATGAGAGILDNIVKQLSLMFPQSEYIHFGGDETRTGSSYTNSWKTCPDCLALMEREGLTDVNNATKEARLQYYFTKYMCSLAAKYGKKIIGWQEVYTTDPADFSVEDLPGACIESWTQAGHGLNAAKAGLKGLLAPSYSHYLSYPQSGSDRNVTLNDCYTKTLNSADAGLTAEQLERLLGTEGCMWTESVTSMSGLEFLLLPRLAAVSEVAWTEFASKDYLRLTESITAKHFDIYDALGYNYRSTQDF